MAYVLAHEYAHNVQQELGWFAHGARFTTVAPFELQADCMAGAWAFAVYRDGLLDDADVQEAVHTAFAVGDFDFKNPQHHGTPTERAKAWKRGYKTGDPSRCQKFTRLYGLRRADVGDGAWAHVHRLTVGARFAVAHLAGEGRGVPGCRACALRGRRRRRRGLRRRGWTRRL